MEFIVDDVADLCEPSDMDLERWLSEHTDAYTRPIRLSFLH